MDQQWFLVKIMDSMNHTDTMWILSVV